MALRSEVGTVIGVHDFGALSISGQKCFMGYVLSQFHTGHQAMSNSLYQRVATNFRVNKLEVCMGSKLI